jgi:tRNA threonylcarbamoyladenosine biosynthesis protein TsaB
MKLLAWDTSSKVAALAALQWDEKSRQDWNGVRLAGEWIMNVEAVHSEKLLWGIHQLLEACGWKLSQVDLFAVGVGPGSFTGLRIGVTTARTLAHSLKKPLIGVSSLAALARPAALMESEKAQDGKTIVVATTDACKGELFALFGEAKAVRDCVVKAEGDLPGLWKRGVEEEVLTPEALIKELTRKLKQDKGVRVKWIAVGEGRKRYAQAWSKMPKAAEGEPTALFPHHVQGRYLGQLAWEAFQAGLARDPLLVHPRYLRASDAELKLRAGLLPAGPTRG